MNSVQPDFTEGQSMHETKKSIEYLPTSHAAVSRRRSAAVGVQSSVHAQPVSRRRRRETRAGGATIRAGQQGTVGLFTVNGPVSR